MSSHRVDTFVLGGITRHPNADLLSVVSIPGTDYTYVARTDDWSGLIGRTVAWIPPDSIVDTTRPEFTFLGPGGGRVRAKKLRGIVSYGLLVLAPTGIEPGEDASAALGVEHYEPGSGGKPGVILGGDVASSPAGVYPKYDVESFLRYGRKVFVPGELVYVSEKLHGASGRFVWMDGAMHCSSRTEWKKEFSAPPTLEALTVRIGDAAKARIVYERSVERAGSRKKNAWWTALDATPGLRSFCESHPGWCVYGEVYGNVQSLRYGITGIKFAAFDVLIQGEPGPRWLDAYEFMVACDEYELPRVPSVGVVAFEHGLIAAMAEGRSLVLGADHIREGVVVKPVVDRQDEAIGRVSLKIINPAYLERN